MRKSFFIYSGAYLFSTSFTISSISLMSFSNLYPYFNSYNVSATTYYYFTVFEARSVYGGPLTFDNCYLTNFGDN